MRDMMRKGRRTWDCGEQHYHAKLRAEHVLAIRHDRRPLREILTEYGIAKSTLYAIRCRQSWKHLP